MSSETCTYTTGPSSFRSRTEHPDVHTSGARVGEDAYWAPQIPVSGWKFTQEKKNS